MAYGYTPKKTLKQKVKRFFLKFSLALAFAAAVGGTGYNYYEKEDVTAKVTQVETIPAKDPNDAPKMIVHTDKGTFENSPTHVYVKDQKDAAAIGNLLTVGATVRFTVYGANPLIGKLNRDSVHFYRNIIKAHLISTGQPDVVIGMQPQAGQPQIGNAAGTIVTEPPAPFVPDPATQILTPPPPNFVNDQTATEVTVQNWNLAEISKNAPQIARDLYMMSQLQLTGPNVYNALKDPANGVSTTLFPVPLGEVANSEFNNRAARIARGSATQTTFHEYFHGWQNINANNQPTMFTLSVKDAVIANLLKESTAVAYEMSAQREAQNHGIVFAQHSIYTEKMADGREIIHYATNAATDPANIQAYNEAYDKAFAANSGLDATTREAKALEAGGRAVVLRLMDGQDETWRQGYVKLVISNINKAAKAGAFTQADSTPEYNTRRDGVYLREGEVSKAINFIPAEYLGPGASQKIDKTFTGLGFTIEKKTTASITPANDKGTQFAENIVPIKGSGSAPRSAFG